MSSRFAVKTQSLVSGSPRSLSLGEDATLSYREGVGIVRDTVGGLRSASRSGSREDNPGPVALGFSTEYGRVSEREDVSSGPVQRSSSASRRSASSTPQFSDEGNVDDIVAEPRLRSRDSARERSSERVRISSENGVKDSASSFLRDSGSDRSAPSGALLDDEDSAPAVSQFLRRPSATAATPAATPAATAEGESLAPSKLPPPSPARAVDAATMAEAVESEALPDHDGEATRVLGRLTLREEHFPALTMEDDVWEDGEGENDGDVTDAMTPAGWEADEGDPTLYLPVVAVSEARATWRREFPSLRRGWLGQLPALEASAAASPAGVAVPPAPVLALARRGMPASIQGTLWLLLLGNPLHVTPALYESLERRAMTALAEAAAAVAAAATAAASSRSRYSRFSVRFRDEAGAGELTQSSLRPTAAASVTAPLAVPSTGLDELPSESETESSRRPDSRRTDSRRAAALPPVLAVAITARPDVIAAPAAAASRPSSASLFLRSGSRSGTSGGVRRRERVDSDEDASDYSGGGGAAAQRPRYHSEASEPAPVLRAPALSPPPALPLPPTPIGLPERIVVPLDASFPEQTTGRVLHCGWLLCQQRRRLGLGTGWKRRWCVLLPRCIAIFKDDVRLSGVGLEAPPRAARRIGGVILDGAVVLHGPASVAAVGGASPAASLAMQKKFGLAFFEIFYPATQLAMALRCETEADAAPWMRGLWHSAATFPGAVAPAAAEAYTYAAPAPTPAAVPTLSPRSRGAGTELGAGRSQSSPRAGSGSRGTVASPVLPSIGVFVADVKTGYDGDEARSARRSASTPRVQRAAAPVTALDDDELEASTRSWSRKSAASGTVVGLRRVSQGPPSGRQTGPLRQSLEASEVRAESTAPVERGGRRLYAAGGANSSGRMSSSGTDPFGRRFVSGADDDENARPYDPDEALGDDVDDDDDDDAATTASGRSGRSLGRASVSSLRTGSAGAVVPAAAPVAAAPVAAAPVAAAAITLAPALKRAPMPAAALAPAVAESTIAGGAAGIAGVAAAAARASAAAGGSSARSALVPVPRVPSNLTAEARWLWQIEFDLARTYPHLAFFAEGSPMRMQMRRALLAYALFRPDIGYVRGMSHVAATLMLVVGTLAPDEDAVAAVTAAASAVSPSPSPAPAPAPAPRQSFSTYSFSSPSPPAPTSFSGGGASGGMLFVPRSMRRDGSEGAGGGGAAGAAPMGPMAAAVWSAKAAADEAAVLARLRPQNSAEVIVFRAMTALVARLVPLRIVYSRTAPQLRALGELSRTVLLRAAPRAAAALDKLGLSVPSVFEPWFASLFTRALGLEAALRLWDRFLVGGAAAALKAAVGLASLLLPVLESGCSAAAARHDLLCVPAKYRDEFALLPLVDAVVLMPTELVALRNLDKAL